METTIEEIDRLLDIPRENSHVEFKEAKNQYSLEKAMSYCVAIANEGGGKLILGVTNAYPRSVVGTQAFLDVQDTQKKCFQKLGFRVDVQEVDYSGSRIVVFNIPARPTGMAYEFEGAYLMRLGEDVRPMSPDRLRSIFNEGKPEWFSEIDCANLTEEKIFEILDIATYFKLTKQPYLPNREIIDRFEQERLLIKTREDVYSITNLGAILFAKQLASFSNIERKALRVIVYDGKDKTSRTIKDMVGTKGYAVGFEGLIDFIGFYLPKNEVIGKALRETIPMYPDIALRELVANAIIHQDYEETGTSAIIEIYTDRIEISNPGLPSISPDRFIDEFQSRNERLAALMRSDLAPNYWTEN